MLILFVSSATIFSSCKKDENSLNGTTDKNSLEFKKASPSTSPSVSTIVVTSIGANSATSGGNVIDNGGGYIVLRGVCWSTSPNPTILDSKTSDGTSGGASYTSNMTGLSPLTTYYVRAYAISAPGSITGYGNQISFTTTTIDFPVLTTTIPSLITETTATSGGNVSYHGSSYVIAKGVCWSTSSNPTIADSKTSQGAGGTSFTSLITGLAPLTTYHVRAYATNIGGFTAYGIDFSFTTYSNYPVLTTNDASAISATYATSGGNVIYNGGGYIVARGVCWSTTQNPTILNSKTGDIGGGTSFTSNMKGLIPLTTYYVRAYATKVPGGLTGYGNEISFTTTAITDPILTTSPATSISSTSAYSGGNISDDGGLPVIERGVCWNTSGNPTIANSKTIDGSGTGTYTSLITGLTLGNYYFVRAYAKNGINTYYGNEIKFRAVKIGDNFQGGKIAYILKPGDPGFIPGATKGIIAATSDQSSAIQWYNGSYTSFAMPTSSELYQGSTNTNTIVNKQGAGNYAAKLCYDLSLNGYDDWFLPSKDELNQLYINKASIGVFADQYYWSSTEVATNVSYAYRQSFYNGLSSSSTKNQTYHVRAIRYF